MSSIIGVQQFLSEYVKPENLEKAENEMCELFVQMHSDLARTFFKEYRPAATKQKEMVVAVDLNDAPAAALEEEEEEEEEAAVVAAPAPRKRKAPAAVTGKKICTGVTAKGKPCGNKCFEAGDYCKIHQKVADKPSGSKKPAAAPRKGKAPAAGSKKKQPKVAPVHTHGLVEEAVEDCDLCQTHGNALDPALDEVEFEAAALPVEDPVGGTIQSRLAGILAQFDEEEEEEEEEEVVDPEVEPEVEPEEEVVEPEVADFPAALDLDSDSDSDSDETIDGQAELGDETEAVWDADDCTLVIEEI